MPERKREPLATTLPYALRDELYARTPPLRMLVGDITAVNNTARSLDVDFGDGTIIKVLAGPGVLNPAANPPAIGDLAYCLAFADSLFCVATRI